MKYINIIIILLIQEIYSQRIVDLNLDLESFNVKAKEHIKERYDFTKENEPFLVDTIQVDKKLLITRFPFDSISIKVVPVFKFKITTYFKDYVDCIDFTLNDTLVDYVLFIRNKIIFDGYYVDKKSINIEKFEYSLVGCSYDFPVRTGSLIGFLYKELPIQDNYIFKIEDFADIIFSIENGLIYANYYDKKGRLEKKEFNCFFSHFLKGKHFKDNYNIRINHFGN